MQGLMTSLLLPPLLLVLVVLAAGLLAWRGCRLAGAAAAGAALLLLLLATPFVAGTLTTALERQVAPPPAGTPEPGAIIVLGGEMNRDRVTGPEVGALTLERLRAAAALHRRTGLPLLVTGGSLARGAPPIAVLMAGSLQADFGLPARWVEARAADTRQNALLSAAMLRDAGIGSAYLVSHAWHLPRAQASFARAGFPVVAAPVRRGGQPDLSLGNWLPRPDHLAQSWYAIREWAGIVVYRLRDGN